MWGRRHSPPFRREQPFGWQAEAVRQLAEMDDRYTRVVAARDFASPPDDPACACRLYTYDGLGQVDEVGTLEARRGRGHARAAVAAAANAASADGCEQVFMVTDAADWPQAPLPPPRLRRDRRHLRVPEAADELTAIIVTMELLPCIVQDARTGEVLTLAYMNDEALAQAARDRRDVVLVALPQRAVAQGSHLRERPEAQGSAAGLRRGRDSRAGGDGRARVPHRRAHLLPQRRARPGPGRGARSAGSHHCGPPGADTYTGHLLADGELVGAKVQEEAEEVVRAARDESDERVAEEAADVLYHLAVLLAERGRAGRRLRVLNERRRG